MHMLRMLLPVCASLRTCRGFEQLGNLWKEIDRRTRFGPLWHKHRRWLGKQIDETSDWVDTHLGNWFCSGDVVKLAWEELVKSEKALGNCQQKLESQSRSAQRWAADLQAERDACVSAKSAGQMDQCLPHTVTTGHELLFPISWWDSRLIAIAIGLFCFALLCHVRQHRGQRVGEVAQEDSEPSGRDFDCSVMEECLGDGAMRLIKIHSSGLCDHIMVVDLICNGCIVSIRKPTPDADEMVLWTQQFQFGLSEGLFDLVEDETTLDEDLLQLTFRTRACESHSLRFQQHMESAEAAMISDSENADADSFRLADLFGAWRQAVTQCKTGLESHDAVVGMGRAVASSHERVRDLPELLLGQQAPADEEEDDANSEGCRTYSSECAWEAVVAEPQPANTASQAISPELAQRISILQS